jgi:hypothetical protein
MASSPDYKRNYKREYEVSQSSKRMLKRRAGMNAARREMEEAGKVRKGDGNHVHHKNHNPRDNRRKNLQITSRSYNTSRNRA